MLALVLTVRRKAVGRIPTHGVCPHRFAGVSPAHQRTLITLLLVVVPPRGAPAALLAMPRHDVERLVVRGLRMQAGFICRLRCGGFAGLLDSHVYLLVLSASVDDSIDATTLQLIGRSRCVLVRRRLRMSL